MGRLFAQEKCPLVVRRDCERAISGADVGEWQGCSIIPGVLFCPFFSVTFCIDLSSTSVKYECAVPCHSPPKRVFLSADQVGCKIKRDSC